MNERFMFHLKRVAAAHVVALLLLTGWSGIKGCMKPRRETLMPIDFMVDVGPSPVAENTLPDPDPTPEDRVPESAAKPQPKVKKPIKVSRNRVVRRLDQPSRAKPLTQEEIRRRLAMGAKAGDRNTPVPGEDALGFELVRQALYEAWNQPSGEEVGGAVAGVTIRLNASGVITHKEVHAPSGNMVMDESVKRALAAVGRIAGLRQTFLARNSVITITFRVD